jgi:hypothetical protein
MDRMDVRSGATLAASKRRTLVMACRSLAGASANRLTPSTTSAGLLASNRSLCSPPSSAALAAHVRSGRVST